MTVCHHSQSILRSFLMLSRIMMQLLISRKTAIIFTWLFSFIRFVSCREEVRRAAYAGKCHYIYPITCIWFKWYLAPSAIFIAGVFAQFRVSLTSSEFSKSCWHWSPGLGIEHCFNALFWTSVGFQGKYNCLILILFQRKSPWIVRFRFPSGKTRRRNPASSLMLLTYLLQILVLRLGTPASLTTWVCTILAPANL